MSLAIVGGTVVDLIFSEVNRLPSWPRHTESTPTNLVLSPGAPIVTLGGNGANAAYVAARCGASVTLHTQLGTDALGGLARRWLESANCRIITSNATATTAVNVTAANRRHGRAIFFHPGVPVKIPALGSSSPAPSHLLVCGWPHPPVAAIALGLRVARRRGIFTALDAGPILGAPWSLRELHPVFGALDLFLTNEYELQKITRVTDPDEALARLRRHFSGHVVVKRGAEGARWFPAGSVASRNVPGRGIRAINTIGAGDSFNGSLLAALMRGLTFPAALRSASTIAASVVSSSRGVLGVRPPGGNGVRA